MWRRLIPAAALFVFLSWVLLAKLLAGDTLDRFYDHMQTDGKWANGRWDHFHAPADTPAKTLVLDALSNLPPGKGSLHDITILRIQEPKPVPPMGFGEPLLALISSDQGTKLVVIQLHGGETYLYRVMNNDLSFF